MLWFGFIVFSLVWLCSALVWFVWYCFVGFLFGLVASQGPRWSVQRLLLYVPVLCVSLIVLFVCLFVRF